MGSSDFDAMPLDSSYISGIESRLRLGRKAMNKVKEQVEGMSAFEQLSVEALQQILDLDVPKLLREIRTLSVYRPLAKRNL